MLVQNRLISPESTANEHGVHARSMGVHAVSMGYAHAILAKVSPLIRCDLPVSISLAADGEQPHGAKRPLEHCPRHHAPIEPVKVS